MKKGLWITVALLCVLALPLGLWYAHGLYVDAQLRRQAIGRLQQDLETVRTEGPVGLSNVENARVQASVDASFGRAIAHVEDGQDLQKPFMVKAIIVKRVREDLSFLAFMWVEDGRDAVAPDTTGLILRTSARGSPEEFRLELYSGPSEVAILHAWPRTELGTLIWSDTYAVVFENCERPYFRRRPNMPRGAFGRTSLCVPPWVYGEETDVAAYDRSGNVSNFVPLHWLEQAEGPDAAD